MASRHTLRPAGFPMLRCLCSSKGEKILSQINNDANLRQAGREEEDVKRGGGRCPAKQGRRQSHRHEHEHPFQVVSVGSTAAPANPTLETPRDMP